MQFEALYNAIKKMVPVKDEDFELFSKDLKVIHLKKKEVWEEEGKISQWMGFIKTGLLRQYYIKDGEEFTTEFFLENEFVGNHVSFQTQTPSKTITAALEPTELFVVPFATFEKYTQSIPSARESADMVGNSKLVQVHDRNASLLMDEPEDRYRKLMEQRPELLNRVPQYLIAQYLGIRPESLSRIRKRFKF